MQRAERGTSGAERRRSTPCTRSPWWPRHHCATNWSNCADGRWCNRCLRLGLDAPQLVDLVEDVDRLLAAGSTTALRHLAARCQALDVEIKALDHADHPAGSPHRPQSGRPPRCGSRRRRAAARHRRRQHRPGSQRSGLRQAVRQPHPSRRPDGTNAAATGSTEAATGRPTAPSTSSRSSPPALPPAHHDATSHRRTAEGLSKREILRCLKRYIAREIYHLLPPTNAIPIAHPKPHLTHIGASNGCPPCWTPM